MDADPKDAALAALAASGVETGQVWRHARAGGLYRVVTPCVLEAGCVPAVAYRGLSDGAVWVRPLADFLGEAAPGVRRFVREV